MPITMPLSWSDWATFTPAGKRRCWRSTTSSGPKESSSGNWMGQPLSVSLAWRKPFAGGAGRFMTEFSISPGFVPPWSKLWAGNQEILPSRMRSTSLTSHRRTATPQLRVTRSSPEDEFFCAVLGIAPNSNIFSTIQHTCDTKHVKLPAPAYRTGRHRAGLPGNEGYD